MAYFVRNLCEIHESLVRISCEFRTNFVRMDYGNAWNSCVARLVLVMHVIPLKFRRGTFVFGAVTRQFGSFITPRNG